MLQLLLLLLPQQAFSELHVDCYHGSDVSDGSSYATAFRTPHAARDHIWHLRNAPAELVSATVTIHGVCELDEPIMPEIGS